jgi:hypothetical protein
MPESVGAVVPSAFAVRDSVARKRLGEMLGGTLGSTPGARHRHSIAAAATRILAKAGGDVADLGSLG